jgi:homoaconitase/3-isopropylmalate dehydratase large subunit
MCIYVLCTLKPMHSLTFPHNHFPSHTHTLTGWGVGGIEAEAVMLGQAVSMVLPEVIGYRITGEMPQNCTATDLVRETCVGVGESGHMCVSESMCVCVDICVCLRGLLCARMKVCECFYN